MSFGPVTLDEDLVRRVRAEFREVPGLRLTPAEARRVWGVDERTCEAVFCLLIESREFKRTPDGRIYAPGSEP